MNFVIQASNLRRHSTNFRSALGLSATLALVGVTGSISGMATTISSSWGNVISPEAISSFFSSLPWAAAGVLALGVLRYSASVVIESLKNQRRV